MKYITKIIKHINKKINKKKYMKKKLISIMKINSILEDGIWLKKKYCKLGVTLHKELTRISYKYNTMHKYEKIKKFLRLNKINILCEGTCIIRFWLWDEICIWGDRG